MSSDIPNDEVIVSRRLLVAALQVCLDPPLHQKKYSTDAYVKWSSVDELRAAAEELGYNWRKYHRSNTSAPLSNPSIPPAD